jgi:hypothetical protein
LILYLCYHLLKHNAARLLWVADLSRALLLTGEASGDALLKTACQRKLDGVLLFSCALAREALDAQLPPAIAGAIDRQPGFARRARSFLEWQLAGLPGQPPSSKAISLMLSAELNPWRRWRYRLQYFVPRRDDRDCMESHGLRLFLIFSPVVRLVRALRSRGAARVWWIFLHNIHE